MSDRLTSPSRLFRIALRHHSRNLPSHCHRNGRRTDPLRHWKRCALKSSSSQYKVILAPDDPATLSRTQYSLITGVMQWARCGSVGIYALIIIGFKSIAAYQVRNSQPGPLVFIANRKSKIRRTHFSHLSIDKGIGAGGTAGRCPSSN